MLQDIEDNDQDADRGTFDETEVVLRQALANLDEQFQIMQQKYLDEKREKEERLAVMQEQYEEELQRLREEADMHKERVRA